MAARLMWVLKKWGMNWTLNASAIAAQSLSSEYAADVDDLGLDHVEGAAS